MAFKQFVHSVTFIEKLRKTQQQNAGISPTQKVIPKIIITIPSFETLPKYSLNQKGNSSEILSKDERRSKHISDALPTTYECDETGISLIPPTPASDLDLLHTSVPLDSTDDEFIMVLPKSPDIASDDSNNLQSVILDTNSSTKQGIPPPTLNNKTPEEPIVSNNSFRNTVLKIEPSSLSDVDRVSTPPDNKSQTTDEEHHTSIDINKREVPVIFNDQTPNKLFSISVGGNSDKLQQYSEGVNNICSNETTTAPGSLSLKNLTQDSATASGGISLHVISPESKCTKYNEISPTSGCTAVSEIPQDGNSSHCSRTYEWTGADLDEKFGPCEVPKEEFTYAPDGGWGWLVLLGCFYMATILLTVASTFGVLFNDVMIAMKASSSYVSWILNVHMLLWNIGSTLSAPLCKHLGWRAVGMTGTLVVSVGFCFMALAVSPLYIFICFSLVIGTAGGIAGIVPFLVLPVYFKKRRGMATTIFLTGISFGQIVAPLLVRGLQDEYGFSGATLIHGSILMNCCVACALFRPLQSSKLSSKNEKETSAKNINPLLSSTEPEENFKEKENVQKRQRCATFCNKFRTVCSDIASTTISNIKHVRKLTLTIVALSMAFLLTGLMNFLGIVPFALVDAGHSAQDASFCIAITGVGNTIVRILMAFIVDQPWLNKRCVFVWGVLLLSGCSFILPLVMHHLKSTLWLLLVWGIGSAASSSVFLVVLIDVVGIDMYDKGLSVTCFFMVFTCVLTAPIIGLVRDMTSSYGWSICASAAVELCAALVWLFMPCATEYEEHVKAKANNKTR